MGTDRRLRHTDPRRVNTSSGGNLSNCSHVTSHTAVENLVVVVVIAAAVVVVVVVGGGKRGGGRGFRRRRMWVILGNVRSYCRLVEAYFHGTTHQSGTLVLSLSRTSNNSDRS